MTVRIFAPSRLHFGLVNAGNVPGVPRFGGLGLMIDTPGVAVSVAPAAEWSAAGPGAERALAIAKRVAALPHRVVVERCPPEHVGLGVGTALSLAVAKALRPDLPTLELAALTGRGNRSGVGLHGFDLGGFIVDGGRSGGDNLPMLISRLAFPTGWRIVLARPPLPPRWHGETEQNAFARAPNDQPRQHHEEMVERREQVVELVRTGTDFAAFAAAIHAYNRQAGVWFEAVQGGIYAGPAVAELVERIQKHGFVGVGQTSWGPTVFAFAEDAEQAEWLAKQLGEDDGSLDVCISSAANEPRASV